ncbi:MAG: HPF/RaiA family ribosome-associated protein [Niabella sp.]
MIIKINTDSHITGSESMIEKYSKELSKKLNRFTEYLTGVEVFFADENRGKSGIDDKKCTIEVRPKNRRSEAVSHNADTIDHAFSGAVSKLKAMLDTQIGKLQN